MAEWTDGDRGRGAALGGVIAFLSSAGTSEDWTLAEGYDVGAAMGMAKCALSCCTQAFVQFPPSSTVHLLNLEFGFSRPNYLINTFT